MSVALTKGLFLNSLASYLTLYTLPFDVSALIAAVSSTASSVTTAVVGPVVLLPEFGSDSQPVATKLTKSALERSFTDTDLFIIRSL